jgi:hypothetical protein
VAISANSTRDIRGIRIWTSARSIERCSRISSSTSSATPTRTMVAATMRSESVLIVSAKRARSSGSTMRSNSSMKMASERSWAKASSARMTSYGVTRAPVPSSIDAGSLPSDAIGAKPIPRVVVRSPISPSALRQMLEKSSLESQFTLTVATPEPRSNSATTVVNEVLPTPRSP